ncbi:AKAP7 2'5' RNA ligase-like domain-containing protein [Mycena vulgaris]|nr:AKAP7 2'5' RNA ligase-like domain-containing protein [Mycena vulgaris]
MRLNDSCKTSPRPFKWHHGPSADDHAGTFERTIASPNPSTSSAHPRRATKMPQNSKPRPPRPTHCKSGHHPELRRRILEFHQKVLPSGDATPRDIIPIEGLDQSILVDPRRLHLTIGVMALSSADKSDVPGTKTVSAAIALLHSLAPEINEITRQPVLLPLDKMGVLKTKRKEAGVLYVAPSNDASEDTIKVGRIFDLVGQRFRSEGFIEDSPRPSVLHCTLINASHRKPRRMPRTFSYPEIFDRVSVDDSRRPSETLALSGAPRPLVQQDREVRVDFGAWAVSEIQLCEMGSHGP